MTLALLGWVGALGSGAWALWLRRLLALRQEGAARACHELRGPIAAARLGLTLATRGGPGGFGSLRLVELELARAGLGAEDLERALVSRARAWEPAPRRLESVDVLGLARDCVAVWAPSAERAGVSLDLVEDAPSAEVLGDPLRIIQALGNLIANGIEHGDGNVIVRVACPAGMVRLEVSDSGTGLPGSVAKLSAGRLRGLRGLRGVRGVRGLRGRGLRGRGLVIAAAVAQSHGGRLASAPAQRGARMVLEFPAAPCLPALSLAR